MAPRFNPGARPCRILVGDAHRAKYGSGDPIQTPHPVNPVNLAKEPPSPLPNSARMCHTAYAHDEEQGGPVSYWWVWSEKCVKEGGIATSYRGSTMDDRVICGE